MAEHIKHGGSPSHPEPVFVGDGQALVLLVGGRNRRNCNLYQLPISKGTFGSSTWPAQELSHWPSLVPIFIPTNDLVG